MLCDEIVLLLPSSFVHFLLDWRIKLALSKYPKIDAAEVRTITSTCSISELEELWANRLYADCSINTRKIIRRHLSTSGILENTLRMD